MLVTATWWGPLLAALAVWQIVDVVHHSVIARPFRLATADWPERSEPLLQFAGKLLSCPYCFSHWVALVVVLASFSNTLWLLCTVLAVTRLANLGNDLAYAWDRTPKVNEEDLVVRMDVEQPAATRETSDGATDAATS